ncbi:MAG: hypothetical protein Q9216_002009 [Gyalolechia sp. 2 TL-2023]
MQNDIPPHRAAPFDKSKPSPLPAPRLQPTHPKLMVRDALQLPARIHDDPPANLSHAMALALSEEEELWLWTQLRIANDSAPYSSSDSKTDKQATEGDKEGIKDHRACPVKAAHEDKHEAPSSGDGLCKPFDTEDLDFSELFE